MKQLILSIRYVTSSIKHPEYINRLNDISVVNPEAQACWDITHIMASVYGLTEMKITINATRNYAHFGPY